MPRPINQILDELVMEIVKHSEHLALNIRTREIADEVNKRLRFRPSTSTIKAILNRHGIETAPDSPHRWCWINRREHE